MPRVPQTTVQPEITVMANTGRQMYFVIYDLHVEPPPAEEIPERELLLRRGAGLVRLLGMN